MAASIPPPEDMKVSGDVARNWDNFRAEFEDYALATGLHDKANEVQAATLRRLMGSECRHIYKHNLGLTAEQGKNAKVILDALEVYFKPARNVVFERYVFGNCKQDEGESIDAFVTKLREKAASCEYGQLMEDLIRDRLVLGVSDERVRDHLLTERDLTLASAVDICRAAEMTDMRTKAVKQDWSPERVHAPGRSERSPPQTPGTSPNTACTSPNTACTSPNTACTSPNTAGTFCGNMHRSGRDFCPAFGKNSGTANHLTKMHHSITACGTQIAANRCTTCCRLYHCPLCPTFKPTKLNKIKIHLEVHYKKAISFEDKKICRCSLGCRAAAHFHCPVCNKTLIRKSDMVGHLVACKANILGETTSAAETTLNPHLLPSPPVPFELSTQQSVSVQQSPSPAPSSTHMADDSLWPMFSPPPTHEHTSAMSSGVTSVQEDKENQLNKKKNKCPHCSLLLYKKNIPKHIHRKHQQNSYFQGRGATTASAN